MLDHIIRSMLRVSYAYVSQRGCALREATGSGMERMGDRRSGRMGILGDLGGWGTGDRGGWAIGDRGGRVSLHDKTTRKVRGH